MFQETTYAYLAGMLDADGTIGIRRFKNSTGQLHYRPMIEIANMSKKVIDLCAYVFGNSTLWYKQTKMSTGKIYNWRVTGKNCKPVLDKLMPYLVIKTEQANLCLKMVSRIGERGMHWNESKRISETAARHELYIAIRELNSHGKGGVICVAS